MKTIVNNLLYGLCILEKKTNITWFRNLKIYILKIMLTYTDYGNNEITNIVCTKPDRNGHCKKAIEKLKNYKTEIFEIYPRGLVYCIFNQNNEMLDCLEEMGYPIEMVTFANNYSLIKRNMKNANKN